MKINPFPSLLTDRLILRRLLKDDWKQIQYLRSDGDVNKFVKRSSAETREKALKFISKINTELEMQKCVYWSICLKGDSYMIGSICLWNFSEDRKKAEVGYDLHPQFHKQGIMGEAMKAILDFGFHQLNLDKIEAFTQQNNEPSKLLLERNNFILNKDRFDNEHPLNMIFEIYSPNYSSKLG